MNAFTGTIHAAADVWPLLPDDELKALAQSIADVGLLEPIMLTPEGELLDGRNRLAACEIAGVEPVYATTNTDPVAYVLARNESRRHMSKGQRALAAWLTATSVNDSHPAGEVAATVSVDRSMVVWAKTVSDTAPALVPQVLDGSLPLKTAYDEAVRIRNEAKTHDEKWQTLVTGAPDLAALVTEERLSLSDALSAMTKRQQEQRDQRRDATALLTRVLDLVPTDAEAAAAWRDRVDLTPDLVHRTKNAIWTLTAFTKNGAAS